MNILVFPGQGSQQCGMAKDIYDNFSYIKDNFNMANDLLHRDLSKIIFEGSKEDLQLTQNSQVAIMLTSVSLLDVLIKEKGLYVEKEVSFVAGHSLGEYSALVASGAFSLETAIKLLKVRAEAMEKAVPAGQGSMLALIGIKDIELAEKIAAESSNDEFFCSVANDNSNGQIILSGHSKAIDKAIEVAKQNNIKIVKKLDVSGPFHSSLMMPARDSLKESLDVAIINDLKTPLIANVTAEIVKDKNKIKDLLLDQLTNRVRWRESMELAVKSGVTKLIEVGPSKVLSGLMKRIDSAAECINIENLENIKDFVI